MKFLWKGKELYINEWLARTLDSLVYNVKKDWDFVVLITGDRGVRVGKSVLAMTVCAYLAMRISETKSQRKILNKDPYNLNNVFFDNKQMVDISQTLKQYSIVHYDEGREGLAANKAMRQFQQDLMDFFAECGQLNHIFVIVCPDFFELKENIAVARSECLINVYRTEIPIMKDGIPLVRFARGNFEFFNKRKKQVLYDMAKSMRRKQYNLVKPNFKGSFTNQYALDEEKYKEKKRDSLARFKVRHEEEIKSPKEFIMRNNLIIKMHKEGKTGLEISKFLERIEYDLSPRRINEICHESLLKEAKSLEKADLEGGEADYTKNTNGNDNIDVKTA